MTLYNNQNDDDSAWFVNFLSIPEIKKTMGDHRLNARGAFHPLATHWALKTELCNEHSGIGFYMVRLKDNDEQIIGFVSLRCNWIHLPDLGFGFLPDYWGFGYATEAATELLRYGVEEMKLCNLASTAGAHNLRSQSVLRKIGFEFRGTLESPKVNLYLLPGHVGPVE